jgi:Pvc16 N-terminal domain
MIAATLDLASVTDALVGELSDAFDNSPLWTANGGTQPKFTLKVNGMPFDLARKETDSQLNLALIHAGLNPSYRNLTQRGAGGVEQPLLPAALTLTYAVSAFSGKDYVREQQAMGIALAWILGNPIQRLTVAGAPPRQVECSMTLETTSLEEMSRMWQALSGAMRLTALIKVSVVFLGPDPVVPAPQGPPDKLGLAVGSTGALMASPQLLVATEPVLVADGKPRSPWQPGQTIVVAGLGLDGAELLFLSPEDDSSVVNVTTWVRDRRSNSLHLRLPTGAGVPPAGPPPAGWYRLRIGLAPHTGASIPVEIGA